MKRKPIYVEIPMQARLDDLWEASQTPDQHEQWDLRFSSITYRPKEHEDDPQDFTYKTNIGLGLAVEGWGRSVGTFNAKDGSRTSSLHFGTDQIISIITEGKGYWKYIPHENGTLTFLTQYDYRTRFGKGGAVVDRFIFRPMIGWATALSFDVLRRWLEQDDAPRFQYIRFFVYWLLAFLFALIWIYHGLLPKVLFTHPAEVAMAESLLPFDFLTPTQVVYAMGIGEVMFGLIWLVWKKRRWLYGLQLAAFPILTISAIVADPSTLIHPFSPVTFNGALFALSLIGFMVSRDIPTARSCKRSKKES